MDGPQKIVQRKVKWSYTPPPESKWHLEARLQHPSNGSTCYGILPPVVHDNVTIFAGGEIVLRYGKHRGNQFSHDGFGFVHIWTRRFSHITDHDSAMTAVSQFVASIIHPGSAIYWEEGAKVAVFCNANGEVIIEERGAPDAPFYSVVTAIKQPVKPQGSRLGAL